MLDMSKLPSHKIENGIVIFDEPCKMNTIDWAYLSLDCDSILLKEGNTDEEGIVYAVASSPEHNVALQELYSSINTENKYVYNLGLSSSVLEEMGGIDYA